MKLQWFEPLAVTVTLSRCSRRTCSLITALPSSSSSSVTGTNLSGFVCSFSLEKHLLVSCPEAPADARLVWLHQLLQQTNLHLGSRECSVTITALMFYSCRTDQRDRKTPSRFILESDVEAKQEVIDLQGSLSETSRVTLACRHFGLLLTRKLSLISAKQTGTIFQNILENLEALQ